MRLALAIGLIGCQLTACAGPERSTAIIVDRDSLKRAAGPRNAEASTAWVGYGVARAAAYDELRKKGGPDRSSDDYPVEVAARAALAEIWKELEAQQGDARDPYLDALVRINDAGFVEEYVVAAFAKPGWTIPAAGLARFDGPGFAQWWESSGLTGLESPTPVRLSTDEGPPREPGAALPDPATLAPSRARCGDSARRLDEALEQWDQEARELLGVAVIAEARGQFFQIAGRFASLEPYKTRGMTWVSPRPFALAFYAGFCAIESGDFRVAEKHLRRAVELAPYEPTSRLELAHVFVQRREFERADAEIDAALGSTEDRCTLGRAHRKRGFIRFEQGRLSDARAEYLRSLDYDPKSELARSELELLDREITRSGGEVPAPYQPPPSQTQLTECAP